MRSPTDSVMSVEEPEELEIREQYPGEGGFPGTRCTHAVLAGM
jgi:hypothetical protein